ncbi:ABC transporter permease [Afifella sp. YEN Y35]|uniref:ABC transporter permease n=1 Tax=Afifella sp. YEN Y35 TaxID=3388337 RepID=UPI0039E09951
MSWIDLIGFGPNGRGGLLLWATLMTLSVTAASLVIGAVFGAGVAAAKLSSSRPARVIGDAYTTILRGAPELLVIYLVYFGGSQAVSAIGRLFQYEGFLGLPSFLAGALAVGMISGAYQAEVYRGAFHAIAKGEIEAARSIGMGRALRFRRIIIPQILRFSLPGLGNVWQLSLKDSALISVTGLAELMRTSQLAAGSTRQYFLFFIVGGILYLVLTTISGQLFAAAERRVAVSFSHGLGRS